MGAPTALAAVTVSARRGLPQHRGQTPQPAKRKDTIRPGPADSAPGPCRERRSSPSPAISHLSRRRHPGVSQDRLDVSHCVRVALSTCCRWRMARAVGPRWPIPAPLRHDRLRCAPDRDGRADGDIGDAVRGVSRALALYSAGRKRGRLGPPLVDHALGDGGSVDLVRHHQPRAQIEQDAHPAEDGEPGEGETDQGRVHPEVGGQPRAHARDDPTVLDPVQALSAPLFGSFMARSSPSGAGLTSGTSR
jgi:hypothetical protein